MKTSELCPEGVKGRWGLFLGVSYEIRTMPQMQEPDGVQVQIRDRIWKKGCFLCVHFRDDDANPDGRLCLHDLRLFRSLYRGPGQVGRGGAEVGEGRVKHAKRSQCPECGEAAVVNEEGCRKCYACGFSEC